MFYAALAASEVFVGLASHYNVEWGVDILFAVVLLAILLALAVVMNFQVEKKKKRGRGK